MGWQILSLPIMSENLKKVCLTAFAESEFGNPDIFRYRIPFCKEIERKRWVDREVNLPEKKRPLSILFYMEVIQKLL